VIVTTTAYATGQTLPEPHWWLNANWLDAADVVAHFDAGQTRPWHVPGLVVYKVEGQAGSYVHFTYQPTVREIVDFYHFLQQRGLV